MIPALSPEVLAERIEHERELREQTERYVNKALRKQALEYERRLDALNHAHEQAVAEQARTVSRELFDVYVKETNAAADLKLKPISDRVNKTESWQDQWSGRVIGLGVIGSAILGLLLAHMAGIGA